MNLGRKKIREKKNYPGSIYEKCVDRMVVIFVLCRVYCLQSSRMYIYNNNNMI